MRLGLGQRLCCCGSCGGCKHFTGGVSVTIAGMTNGNCTACENYNTTYILDSITRDEEAVCIYRTDFPRVCPALSAIDAIGLRLFWDGTDFTIEVGLAYQGAEIERSSWRKTILGGKSCSGVHVLTPYGTGDPVCTEAGSTATVDFG